MAKDLKFTSEKLLDIKFPCKDKGYDPYQVDLVLDQIIEDYRYLESNDDDVENLKSEIIELKKINRDLKEQLDKEKNRVKYLPRDQKDVHIDNYELLIRIGKLEALIHQRLGINPEDIK